MHIRPTSTQAISTASADSRPMRFSTPPIGHRKSTESSDEMTLVYSEDQRQQGLGAHYQTAGPFEVRKGRAESPVLGRRSSPPTRLSSQVHTSPPPKRPSSPLRLSADVSICPHSQGLELVSLEDTPAATTQKDTFGSHTIYTFRVRLQPGQ